MEAGTAVKASAQSEVSSVQDHALQCRLPYLEPDGRPWATDCYCLCCDSGFSRDDLDPDDPTYCPWCGCRVWWYNETFESLLPRLQRQRGGSSQ